MTIACALLDQLDELAATNALARIERVHVQAGERRGIVPEAMQLAFREAARGGPAAGAVLELEILPARARCRLCGHEFAPAPDSYLCTACGQADVDLVAGDDIVLKSITGETNGESDDEDQRRDERPQGQ